MSTPPPRTGLTKKPATAGAPAAASTSKKNSKSAQQHADSFARGNQTLGQSLGMTQAQKDMLRQRAYAMLNEQRLDSAEPLLEGLVALDPFDPWVLTALGGLKLDRGAHEIAAALLERAVQVSPFDVVARALRAEARAKSGNVAGAKEDIAALDKADANLPAIKRVRALAAAIAATDDGSSTPAAAPTGSTAAAPTPTKPGVPAAKPTTTAAPAKPAMTTSTKPAAPPAPSQRINPHQRAPSPEETSAIRRSRAKLP